MTFSSGRIKLASHANSTFNGEASDIGKQFLPMSSQDSELTVTFKAGKKKKGAYGQRCIGSLGRLSRTVVISVLFITSLRHWPEHSPIWSIRGTAETTTAFLKDDPNISLSHSSHRPLHLSSNCVCRARCWGTSHGLCHLILMTTWATRSHYWGESES